MNIYKIYCPSDCGSYFASYLQSITVVAKDEASAITYTTEWMSNPMNPSFVYPFERVKKDRKGNDYTVKWQIELLLSGIGDKEPSIIDSIEDSDY